MVRVSYRQESKVSHVRGFGLYSMREYRWHED